MADETWPLEFHRYHATDDDSPGNIGWREAAILLSPEREGLKQGVGPRARIRGTRSNRRVLRPGNFPV